MYKLVLMTPRRDIVARLESNDLPGHNDLIYVNNNDEFYRVMSRTFEYSYGKQSQNDYTLVVESSSRHNL